MAGWGLTVFSPLLLFQAVLNSAEDGGDASVYETMCAAGR